MLQKRNFIAIKNIPLYKKNVAMRLGYPDSNQERQDQNLQCYHYTISQFVSSNCLLLICDCKGSAFFSYPKTFCAFFHKKFHFSGTLYHYSEN